MYYVKFPLNELLKDNLITIDPLIILWFGAYFSNKSSKLFIHADSYSIYCHVGLREYIE